MTPESVVDNLLPWVIQISVVSLLGTALPLLFGIRHPRTQLVYGYVVLVLCLLLPFLQPHIAAPRPVVAPAGHAPAIVSGEPAAKTASAAVVPSADHLASQPGTDQELAGTDTARDNELPPAWAWREALLAVIVAGALFRLGRLAIGAWQIRRYRLAAAPLYPVPETIVGAEALVRARAVMCLSYDVSSPATLGLFRPVVLMPASFLTLNEDAQQAIACHELLHVRRLDWFMALVEGIISALFWFCPVAWLISEIRLTREQLIDGEVIRLTAEKHSYIEALLQIARARPTLDIVPAPLFIRRRHLTHRVQMLLEGASSSLRRLSFGYASSALLLITGAVLAVAWFPLVMPQAVEAASVRIDSLRETSTPPPTAAVPPPVAARAPIVRAPGVSQADEWAEPIVGPIDTASSPAERAAALALLERARQNSDLHIAGTPPFHLEATFEASGHVAEIGSGALSETWMSGKRWRWTALLGGYSSERIGSGRTGFDVDAVRPLPMRVHMLRRIILGPIPPSNPGRVRVAPAQVSGTAVTCVLLGPATNAEPPVRHWQEDEYCVDAAGLLRVHSPALGAYTRFDYGRPLRFGGRVLPGELRAYIGGVEVVRARLSIRPAGDPDDALFTPTSEMMARGLAPTTGVAQKVLLHAPAADVIPGAPITVVHAAVDASGIVLEAEVVSGDPQHAPAALDVVRAHRFPNNGIQRDAYVGVDFGAPVDTTP